jgi:hypothetical protein
VVEADDEGEEVLPESVGDGVETVLQALEGERADHGAIVIDEGKNDGLALIEVTGERDPVAAAVGELKVEGDLAAGLLLEVEAGELRRVFLHEDLPCRDAREIAKGK